MVKRAKIIQTMNLTNLPYFLKLTEIVSNRINFTEGAG